MGSTSIARWAYSTAKTVDEVLGFAYHKERGLDVVIARFFNTVGPRQTAAYGMVIPTLVDQAVVGAPLTVHGSGRQTRCFCHVLDTVQAVLALLGDERASGDVFNVGSSDEIAIDELARRIVATADSASVVRLVPYAEVYERDFEDMLRRVPDTGKLRALTGWRPTKTLTDILEESIQEARLEAAYAAADQR